MCSLKENIGIRYISSGKIKIIDYVSRNDDKTPVNGITKVGKVGTLPIIQSTEAKT